jgi:hypothetical protein
VKIVGLMSSYLEGRLTLEAVRSLEEVGCDNILIYEGPAGAPLDTDAPASIFPVGAKVHEGRWRTDGRKRDAMLQEAKRRSGSGPVWGVWLDGDEILVNAKYLRDVLESVTVNDEYDGTGQPTIHWPLRVIESHGGMAITNARLFRVDLVRSIDISVSVVTNHLGIEEAWGNTNPDARLWVEMWMKAVETGRMMAWPPHPCEPHIYHRSNLRHPARRGLRLHEQEAAELKKAGKL